MKLNEMGAAAIQIEGHNAEVYAHENGVSAEVFWEENEEPMAEEWHFFSQNPDEKERIIEGMKGAMKSGEMLALGFVRVEREGI